MSFFTISLLIIYGLIVVLNLAFSLSWATLLYMFISLAIVLLPAAIFLFVGRMLPRKWFSNDKLIFRENKFKNYICKITNVKVWKDKIPVGGHVAGFRMNKLDSPKDLEYLDRYLYESCFADWLHTSCAVWGLISLIFVAMIDVNMMLTLALPVAVVFFFQNMISTIIQWYMRPRIARLRGSVSKRLERENLNKN